ncbi:hypothetical protein AB0I75_09285 [Streptomyces sp. NPDC050273]|uniref:hypothetical protein n=1 Tax=Streptomyces sp. NPDC050273 TaxID=3154933 RepID=UPI003433A463
MIVPATVGGLFFTGLGIDRLREATTADAAGWPHDEGLDVLAMTVSVPMNSWGPLLLLLTYARYRHRRT